MPGTPPTIETLLTSFLQYQYEQNEEQKLRASLDEISNFDGKSSLVHNFISSIDEIYLENANNQKHIRIITSTIKNSKLTGKASEKVSQANLKTWTEIKTFLVKHFCDNRPIASYIVTMADARPYGKTAFEFLSYIEQLQNSAISQARIIDPNTQSHIKLICEVALKSFIRALTEPLRTQILAGRPNDLQDIKDLMRDHFYNEASRTMTKNSNYVKTNNIREPQSFTPRVPQNLDLKQTNKNQFPRKNQPPNIEAMSARTTSTLRTLHNIDNVDFEEENDDIDNSMPDPIFEEDFLEKPRNE